MNDPLRSNDPQSAPSTHRKAFFTALRRGDLREAWWAVLDMWEAKRTFRRLCYIVGALALFGSVYGFWIHPRWTQRNAIRMARQWIEAGNLQYAADTLRKAIERDPRQPELWSLAAELARFRKQKELEVEYARRAMQAAPGEARYVLELASAALRADMTDIAEQTLSELPAAELTRSGWAHRMLGEMRRREQNLAAARGEFEAALKIDGPGAVDEVPLALCLLADGDTTVRQRGRELLGRWTADAEWGATVLRVLLEDATRQGDKAAVLKHAQSLRVHPQCTFGDMPVCLQGIAFADNDKFGEVLSDLETKHAATPEAAAQLAGWLNQIGKSAEAVAWLRTLPAEKTAVPPLAQARAEALRCTDDWATLRDFAEKGQWGQVEFVRWCYALKAARMLGDGKHAEELWNTLYGHALTNSVHAHFSGSLLYSWGMVQDAEALWWRAAGGSGIAYEALGALARHYQVQRDAEGQYRVFSQLRTLRPKDDDVANNFAFFAVLTGRREQEAERLMREVVERHPSHPGYLSTQAYILSATGRPSEALRIVTPLAARWPHSPAVQFALGLALAGTGEKEKAAAILRALPPETLTLREIEIIDGALAH